MTEDVKEYPVTEIAHVLDDKLGLYNLFGLATKPSEAGLREADNPQHVERSLYSRTRRAELLKQMHKGQISRVEAVAQGHRLDEIDRQFSRQERVAINVEGLGDQVAEYADISLPEAQLVDPVKPPIFFIPAYSGDLYGIEPLLKEAALQGRRVVSIAYPESHNGTTTEEFANEVGQHQDLDPHTAYFKAAIDKLVGEEGQIEIWGYSTGGAIGAEILNDPAFQDRTTNAVFIAPAGCVDQTEKELMKGARAEAPGLLRDLKRSASMSVVMGSKLPVDAENLDRRKRISAALMTSKVCKSSDAWHGARVQEGGRVLILSGDKDQITKSAQRSGDFVGSPNDQLKLVNYVGAGHLTPLLHADTLVPAIADLQERSFARFTEIAVR